MRLLFDLFWLICFGGWLSFLISLPNIKKASRCGDPSQQYRVFPADPKPQP